MFTLVLLALADKADGATAAQLAATLAARHGAGFAALSVSGPLSQEGGCVLQLPGEEALAERRAGVETLLREVMPQGLTADVMHAAGFAHVEALKTARILGPDLLVLGGLDETERCRRELSASRSSAAALLARDAPCPVLVAGADVDLPAGPFERVLAAVDLSGETGPNRALLAFAARLAAREGGALVALHALELPADQPTPDHEDMVRRVTAARERLAYLGHGLPGAERFTLVASEGAAGVEILKQARECGADLLVLAVGHGSGGTLERVLEGARCPVLLLGPAVLAPAVAGRG